jgi:transcriptional regulator with XRE-family HTH domain
MPLNIGQTIRRLRDEAGLTQDELALRLGVSDKTISKWETGGGLPDITQIVPLSQIFGVSADILFGLPTPGIRQLEEALFNVQEVKRSGADVSEAFAICERIGYGIINNSKDVSDIVLAHSYLVGLYSDYGKTAKAEEHANALPIRPIGRDGMIGVIKAENGDPNGALTNFANALAQSLSAALSNILDAAMTYLEIGKYMESINCHKVLIAVVEAVYGENTYCYPVNAYVSPQFIAQAYYRVGDYDSALDWLEWTYDFCMCQSKGAEGFDGPLLNGLAMPERSDIEAVRWKAILKSVFAEPWRELLEKLRDTPRYKVLLERVGEIDIEE